MGHFGSLQMKAKLRVIGSLGLILGQCVLLFSSREIGLVILITSSLLGVPFSYHHKYWDVILVTSFMTGINMLGLVFK